MKMLSLLKKAQIKENFYGKVRTQSGIEEFSYETESLGEDFFFGDIDDEGKFIIKHHRPQGREKRIEPDGFCIAGRVADTEEGSEIEYSYERTHVPLEMWFAWAVVYFIFFLMLVFRDIIAGVVLLLIAALHITLMIFSPKEKYILRKVLKSIVFKI